MKNKWIKNKQDFLKNQEFENVAIQSKESVRHIKNNIEDNKEADKIEPFSDFLIYIIRKVTMKYNLCCKLWSGLTLIEVKTNLNGDFITISDALLKQILLGLTIDNQLVFRTIDKDTDFFVGFQINWLYQCYKEFCEICSGESNYEFKKDMFFENYISSRIEESWNNLIFRTTSC